MNNIKRRPKIGVLIIGSPRYKEFGEGTTRGKYSERKESEGMSFVKVLNDIGDIVYPGIVYDNEQVITAMKQFYSNSVDFIIAQYVSWAEDFAWIRFLRDIPDIPIFLCCVIKDKYAFGDITEEDEFLEFLSTCRHVGTLQASGSINRVANRKVKTFIGNLESCIKEIRIFAQAAKAKSILKNSIFGLLPNYHEVMWSTYVDPYNLFCKVGPQLKFIPSSTLADEINKVSDEVAKEYTKILEEKYYVMEDVDRNKFVESVRASIGVEKLARKMDLDVVVINDIDPVLLSLLGLRPGFCPAALDDNAAIVTPEGDIGAAIAVFILKLLSGEHVNFIEPFYIDNENGYIVIGHAGPNDYTDHSDFSSVKIATDARFAKSNYKFAGAPFAWYRLNPGRKTILHISECNSQYKMVCTLADALETDHFIPNYSHGIIKPISPAINLFKRLLDIGVTQHFAIVDGNFIKQLKYLSHIMEFDFYYIE